MTLEFATYFVRLRFTIAIALSMGTKKSNTSENIEMNFKTVSGTVECGRCRCQQTQNQTKPNQSQLIEIAAILQEFRENAILKAVRVQKLFFSLSLFLSFGSIWII